MKFKPGQLIKKFKAKNGKEVVIRTIKYGDLKLVLNYINKLIEEDTFIMTNEKKSFKEEKNWIKKRLDEMKKGKGITLISGCDKKIVGISQLDPGSGDRSPHVCNFGIGVLKKYRSLGIGKEMTRQIITIAKKMKFKIILLGVFANNEVAIRLYKKLGFKQVARLPKIFLYKGKYVDDIWMVKKL